MFVRFLSLAFLLGGLFSCSSGDSDGVERALAVTGDLQITLANKSTFTLEGSCTLEGAEITVTLGSFVPWRVSCTNFTWQLSVPSGTVDQIVEGRSTSLSVTEAGNSTAATAEVQKDVTAPTVGLSASPDVISTVNQGDYSLGGNCSEKGTITVAIGTLEEKTTECPNGQNWSVNFDVSALTVNEVDIVVNMVDEVGNTSVVQTVSVSRDVDAPQVSNDDL